MKCTFALVATILAAAVSAAPAIASRDTVPTISVAVTNDQTGASAIATVPGDGIARNLTDLFRDSAIDQNGAIMATSAQLVKFTESTRCFFQNVNWIINMNGKDLTYADIDGQAHSATPINMNGFNLQCV